MSACVGECVECSSPRCDNCEAFLPCLLQTCMTCPWDICSKILCHECYKNHRHSVLVAQPHFDRWVNELMGSWVVLRGLRFTGYVNGDHAYCCLEVKACVIEDAGTILHFIKAHISIADIVLQYRPGHTHLSSKFDATNLFWTNVCNKHQWLPPAGLRGRLGHFHSRPWRGPGPLCCLELCNDTLGNYCQTLAHAFQVFQPERPRSLQWLPGRDLHLSIYHTATLVQERFFCTDEFGLAASEPCMESTDLARSTDR